MVLNCVVSPPIEYLGDLGPPVVHQTVHKEEDPLFFPAPETLFYLRVQVVVPALAALLPDAPGEVICDLSPLDGTVLLHKHKNFVVFFRRPGTLDQVLLDALGLEHALLMKLRSDLK